MIEWAMPIWPYVNGKALMSGIRLKELEASEMLDVLHFLMEEDFVPTTPEMAEARSDIRVVLYRQMYNRDYPYKLPKKAKSGGSSSPAGGNFASPTADLDSIAPSTPFDPREAPPKPFTPATEFDPDKKNPFEGVLDAPLN